ncbi:MAG: hypothetical protein U5S82_11740 [Gammaproteobacteria bacterium]|nr:hypothetical protein [Gammaproteobacteria bacterium]
MSRTIPKRESALSRTTMSSMAGGLEELLQPIRPVAPSRQQEAAGHDRHQG